MCVHVLSMHLTLRTTGGGLDRLTWQRDVGMLQPPGALQPQTAIVLGASVQKAPILINTTYLCQTEQITAPAPLTTAAPTPKQARITSQPDYSVCIRSRCNGTSVVRDE